MGWTFRCGATHHHGGPRGEPLPWTPQLAGVRGFAASIVVLAHYFGEPPAGVQHLKIGWFGVSIFFVLSGFLIGSRLLEAGLGPGRLASFLVRRAGRILPAYLLLVCGVTLASVILEGRVWVTKPFSIWTYLTFTQDIARIHGYQGLWLEPTWTLAVEEQFYLLLPLLLLLPRRAIAPVMAGLVLLSLVFRLTVFGLGLPDVLANNTLLGKMDLLLCGVLAAWARRNLPCERFLPALRIALAPAILSAVLLFVLGGLDVFAVWAMTPLGVGLASFLLALSLGAPEFRSALSSRALRFLGAVSFGLYLFHQPVNVLLHGLVFNDGPALGSPGRWMVTGAALVLSVGLAAASYRFVEAPLLRRARGWADRLDAGEGRRSRTGVIGNPGSAWERC